MSCNHQLWRRQHRLNIDLHHSSAWHSNSEDFIGQIDGHNSGPAISDAFHCLLADHVFDATAPNPTQYYPGIPIDERLRAGLGGTRTFDLNDCGDGKWRASQTQFV